MVTGGKFLAISCAVACGCVGMQGLISRGIASLLEALMNLCTISSNEARDNISSGPRSGPVSHIEGSKLKSDHRVGQHLVRVLVAS